jgi:SAM-dependent methyltransferase
MSGDVRDLLRLNLGCGLDIMDGFVNADLVALPGVDQVCDLDVDPWPWKDARVAYIKASHVYEHVDNPVLFMTEAWRILAPGGLLDIRVPWFRHPNSFTDPTHKRHCTERTFSYWVPGTDLHEAYGAGYGSPPAVYEPVSMSLNGHEQEELQVVLRKPAGGK